MLVFLRFNRPSFPERRAGDGVFDISLPSAIDLLACIPAGRKEERDKLVTFLRFRHLSFPERGVGSRVFCDIYNQRRRFWYACQRVGRASALNFSNVWRFRRSNSPERGAEGGIFGGSLHSAVVVCMAASREDEREKL